MDVFDTMSDSEMLDKLMTMAEKRADDMFKILTIKDKRCLDGRELILSDIKKRGIFENLVRDSYNAKYSWPLIDINLINGIAKFLKSYDGECDKTCLSVMSGKGYLEKFLQQRDCDIIATDIIPSKEINLMNEPVVLKYDALKAINFFDRNVLLVSWPPYNDTIGEDILNLALQTGYKYVIYIGEYYGCCATNHFFEILSRNTTKIQDIDMLNFKFVNDCCSIYKSEVGQKTFDIQFRSQISKKICMFVQHNSFRKNKTLKILIKKYFNVKLANKHFNFIRTLLD